MALHKKELPTELVVEILSRTSLQTLDRCKAVCKGWKQLIDDQNFMLLYGKRSYISGFIIQTPKLCDDIQIPELCSEYDYTVVSMHQKEEGEEDPTTTRLWSLNKIKILATSNQGICCCKQIKLERESEDCYRYYACKPATQQWQPLPNPWFHFPYTGIGIVVLGSSPLRYKIVRLARLCRHQCLCEIFDSKTWTWRLIQYLRELSDSNTGTWRLIQGQPWRAIPCWDINLVDQDLTFRYKSATCVGNSFYWLTISDSVVEFNASEERIFCMFLLPESVYKKSKYVCKELVEWKGRLGLSCVHGENGILELWVMEEGSNHSKVWNKEISDLNVGIPEEEVPRFNSYSSQIAVARLLYGTSFFKVQDSRFASEISESGMSFELWTKVFPLRSDLDVVNLRGGR